MATFRKRGKNWYAEIYKNGVRKGCTFDTKAEATAWAAKTETEILQNKHGSIPDDKSFADLLTRYRDSVSINKRGKRWETIRLNKVIQTDKIAQVRLPDLSAVHVAAWRDRRLAEISAASVHREWNLLSHCCAVAIKEWQWLTENPFREVKRPPEPAARWRRITDDEIDRLMMALGYAYDQTPETTTARVCAAFLFAIETGMRAGEICGLTWEHVKERHVHLPQTKNGTRRDVPLSQEARRIIDQLPKIGDLVFNISVASLDALFRKGKARCLIDDLHFHDARHEALTRLSSKLNVMELAKIAGIRDLRILQNVYYNPKIEDLADKL